ncbi:Protein Tax-1 [Entophlyctis luteolus]|nr:Protein Tax-1 [Entophlyctis luteolus]
MYKVEIPIDRLQQAAISRRQRLDAERKKRIFEPKTRVFGDDSRTGLNNYTPRQIDVKALDEQLRIKNEIKQFDHDRDAAYGKEFVPTPYPSSKKMDADQYAAYTNQILTLMDDQTAAARRSHLQKMNEFRQSHQRQDQGRDFDLIDPAGLRKELPARVGDKDSRCGVSGLQVFEGEDLGAPQRTGAQKEQMKTWVKEELWEKRCRDEAEAEAQRKYEEYQRNVAARAAALQRAVDDAKRSQYKADNAFNQSLAAQKKQREIEEKERTLQQNTQEILNNLNGVFLTETPDVTNIKGGHKVRVDLFKGITPQQKQEMLAVQAYQRVQNERKREEQQLEEARYALQQSNHHRALVLLEREKARLAKQEAIRIRNENAAKAVEDRERQKYLNTVVYTNPPTDAYFSQFNTTSR